MRRPVPADVNPMASPADETVKADAIALDMRDLCFALALGLVVLLIWLHAAGPGTGAGFDFFTAYWRAAGEVASGGSPYQQLARLAASPGASGLRGTGYVYPPFLAVLLSIPVRLGFNKLACWLLWTLVNVTAVVWMGYELNLSLRNSRSWTGTMAFVVAALLPAVVTYDIGLGQADLLMAALAVGSYGLWLRGHHWSASVILGVAIAIKPTLALALLVWLWKGDWGACLRGAVAAFLLIFLPFAFIGLSAMREYVTFLLHWNAFGANADFINQTPFAFLLRTFTVNPAMPPLLVAPFLVGPLRLAAMAGTILLWLRATPRARLSPILEMGSFLLVIPVILLLSPLAEDIHFTMLAPVLVGLGWIALAERLYHLAAAWALWIALLFSSLPRMQELIYPQHLLILPGQTDPRIGTLITLLRTSALLWLAVIALVAGQAIMRAARLQAENLAKLPTSRPSPS
jgi:Glycosyltransferase family 87